jgi:hypothetical protein
MNSMAWQERPYCGQGNSEGPETDAQIDSSPCEVKSLLTTRHGGSSCKRKREELPHAPDRHAVGQRRGMVSARHRRPRARTTPTCVHYRHARCSTAAFARANKDGIQVVGAANPPSGPFRAAALSTAQRPLSPAQVEITGRATAHNRRRRGVAACALQLRALGSPESAPRGYGSRERPGGGIGRVGRTGLQRPLRRLIPPSLTPKAIPSARRALHHGMNLNPLMRCSA